MSAQPHTVIGQMLFLARPPVALRQLVADLDRALAALITPARRLHWPTPAMAHFEFEGGRIVIAFDSAPCPPWQACLTISVGDGTMGRHGRLGSRYGTLAHKIAEDISRYHRADATRWVTLAARVDVETVAALVGQLEHASETLAARAHEAAVFAARSRLPRIDETLVTAKDMQLRGALDRMRRAREEAEAQFAMSERRQGLAQRLWRAVGGWLRPQEGPLAQPAPVIVTGRGKASG